MENLKLEKQQETTVLILRLLVGLLIMLHGVGNLLSGYGFIKGVLGGYGLPGFMAYGVFIGEIVAPILIVVGYRTRIAALVLAFNMLVAVLLAHFADIFALNQFGGWAIELQAFYLFGAVALFFSGAGKHALSNQSIWD